MIIAANFKTNHTRASTKEYIEKLNNFVKENSISDSVRVFPPVTALDLFCVERNIKIGVQNAYPVEKGSYTGEIGLSQIDEYGLGCILIGHSERRHVLGESQELIAQKYNYYMEKGFEIIYCIGEPQWIREEGIDSVMEYNHAQLKGIDLSYDKLVVAYEPVWAIGTGLTASTEQIEETLSLLRQSISAPLLYGGSVKPSNTKEILSIKNCDGILVGTASWNIDSFCQMLEISKDI
jgi:triosephosphate isomerase